MWSSSAPDDERIDSPSWTWPTILVSVRDSLERWPFAAFAIMSPIWLTLADADDAGRATPETHPNLEAR